MKEIKKPTNFRMSSDDFYTFDPEICSSNDNHSIEIENVVHDNFESIDQIIPGIEILTLQRKCFKNIDDTLQRINREIALMALHHEKADKIVGFMESLINDAKSACLDNVVESLSNINQIACNIARESVSKTHEYILNRLHQSSSRYKRQQLTANNIEYVAPDEKAIGLKWVVKPTSSDVPDHKIIQTTFQYVSITKTLTALFKSDDFRKVYFQYNQNRHECVEGEFRDFCCGSKFKHTPIFSQKPLTVQIQISADEFDVSCPIKSKAGIHKMIGVYFRILNQPPESRSRMNNIYLIALCNSHNMKSDDGDFDYIAEMIVNELKQLENNGFIVDNNIELNATLVNVLADNLGFHMCYGLTESFNAHYCCRFCECNKMDRQEQLEECPSKMRTKTSYEQCLTIVEKSRAIDLKQSFGVKRPCVFNEIGSFHILENLTVDVMHDILEGVGSFLIDESLKWMCQNGFTEDDVVAKVRDFNYGPISKKNKPSILAWDKSKLGQSAIQVYCLLTNFPFIFVERESDLIPIWRPVQTLLGIMQIVFSDLITESDLRTLTKLIAEHLSSVKSTFDCRLKVKHHILTHYPTVIREMGPVIYMSMMRMDAKHKIFTDLARNTQNFVNITKTLAERHQNCIAWSPYALFDQIETSKTSICFKKCVDFYKYERMLPNFLLRYVDELKELKFLHVNGTYFVQSLMVIFDKNLFEINHVLQFGDEYFLACVPYTFVNFNSFCHSVEIKAVSDSYAIIDIKELSINRTFEKIYVNEIVNVAATVLNFPKNKFRSS